MFGGIPASFVQISGIEQLGEAEHVPDAVGGPETELVPHRVLSHVMRMPERETPPIVRLLIQASVLFTVLERGRSDVSGIAWGRLGTSAGAGLPPQPFEIAGVELAGRALSEFGHRMAFALELLDHEFRAA